MYLGRVLSSPLPGEKVIFYLRKHWYKFLKIVLFYTFLSIIPGVILLGLLRFYPGLVEWLFNGALVEVLVKLGLSLYYLAVWLFFWNTWVDYYLDVWLVTNERILHLEQKGLFSRTTSELRLNRVQDVAADVKGLAATIFDFGTVRVQTAGTAPNFIFELVPDPHKIAEQIMRLADAARVKAEPIA